MIPLLCAASAALTVSAVGAARRSAATQRVLRRLTVSERPGPRGPHRGYRGSPPAWLKVALVRAGFDDIEPGLVWQRWLVIGTVAASISAVAAGPALTVLVVVVVATAPAVALWAIRGRGDRRFDVTLPTTLESVAANMRSGTSILQALATTAAATPGVLGGELAAVVAVANQGSPLQAELDRWSRRRPGPGLRLAVAALALGTDTGGPQARALDAVAATLRDREAARREAIALSSQARASAVVMAVAPLVFAVVASLIDPRVGHVLVATPIGLICLAGGILLDAAAGLWMLHITGADP